MEYRGIEYTVVQTANPTGWKWTISLAERRTKTGTEFSRIIAIRAAEKVIDGYVKKQTRSSAEHRTKENSLNI